MSDLWAIASADIEAETTERYVASARVASTQTWGFLTAAASRQDFENRRAIASEQLDRAVHGAIGDDLAHFASVRVALEDSIIVDFDRLHTERQAAVQAENNRRAARRNAEREAQRRVAAGHTAVVIVDNAGKTLAGPFDTEETAQKALDKMDTPGARVVARPGEKQGHLDAAFAAIVEGRQAQDHPEDELIDWKKKAPKKGEEDLVDWSKEKKPGGKSKGRNNDGTFASLHVATPSFDEIMEQVRQRKLDGPAPITSGSTPWTLSQSEDNWIGNFTDDALAEAMAYWVRDNGQTQPNQPGYNDEMMRMLNEALPRRTSVRRRVAARIAHTAGALQDAVTEFSFGRQDLKVGDVIDGFTITDVGTHTVQATDGTWNTSVQIQFIDNSTEGNGRPTPAGIRAGVEASRRTAAQYPEIIGKGYTGFPGSEIIDAWTDYSRYTDSMPGYASQKDIPGFVKIRTAEGEEKTITQRDLASVPTHERKAASRRPFGRRTANAAQDECPQCQADPGYHAGLHAGHIWSNTRCPAYKSLDGDDCNCSTTATASLRTALLFGTADEAAANPPDSWVAVKSGNKWNLTTKDGGVLNGGYSSKAAAEADKTSGPFFKLWNQENAWRSGDTSGYPQTWKPFTASRHTAGADGYRVKRAGIGQWQDLGDVPYEAALEAMKGLVDSAQRNTVLLLHNNFNDSVTVIVMDALGHVDSISSYEQFYGTPYTSPRTAARDEDCGSRDKGVDCTLNAGHAGDHSGYADGQKRVWPRTAGWLEDVQDRSRSNMNRMVEQDESTYEDYAAAFMADGMTPLSPDDWMRARRNNVDLESRYYSSRRVVAEFPPAKDKDADGDADADPKPDAAKPDAGGGWAPIDGAEFECEEMDLPDGGNVYATLNESGTYHWGGTDATGNPLPGGTGFASLDEAKQAAEAASGQGAASGDAPDPSGAKPNPFDKQSRRVVAAWRKHGQWRIQESPGRYSGGILYTLQFMPDDENAMGYGVWEDVTSSSDKQEVEVWRDNPPSWWGS